MTSNQCGCEHGQDCTKTTMCKVQTVAEDLEAAEKKLEALNDIYHSANLMLSVLGAAGEITTRHETVTDLMDSLHDYDGGVYDCKLLNRTNKAEKTIADTRAAFKDYFRTEGCSCCRDMEGHETAAEKLGELLGFERYSDDSGWDFYENPKEAES